MKGQPGNNARSVSAVAPRTGVVHGILETGSAKGTAFPSSHVAATVSAWIAAGLYDRRAFWILAPFAVSLTLGTVYGRFHYGIDALAGLFFAAVAVPWAPRLMRRLAPVAPAGNAVTDAAIEDPTNDHGSDRYA